MRARVERRRPLHVNARESHGRVSHTLSLMIAHSGASHCVSGSSSSLPCTLQQRQQEKEEDKKTDQNAPVSWDSLGLSSSSSSPSDSLLLFLRGISASSFWG